MVKLPKNIPAYLKRYAATMSEEMAVAIVKSKGNYLYQIPVSKRTLAVCLAATKTTPYISGGVPEQCRTRSSMHRDFISYVVYKINIQDVLYDFSNISRYLDGTTYAQQ